MNLYDENQAVSFILRELEPDTAIDNDSILEVIDRLYDYYEENDSLDFDFDEDDIDPVYDSDEDDIDAIVEYISKKSELPAETIRRIVIAEQKYQDTLL